MSQPRVAVVGAGMAGLTCARDLARQGFDVHVYDKSRGVGGRLATRRGEGESFDHGAQYFTARDPDFRAQVTRWQAQGLAAPWAARITSLGSEARPVEAGVERFVGIPGMSALCRDLAGDLPLTCSARIIALERGAREWRLRSEDGRIFDSFAAVVLAMPPAQAATLCHVHAPALAARAKAVPMAPCHAVMLSFGASLGLDFDAAFVHGPELSWIARNDSKPGRPPRESWVLHSTSAWAERHVDADAAAVIATLGEAFAELSGCALPSPHSAMAHRWLYALPTAALEEACLAEPESGLYCCGDWCGGPRVEGAWHSGRATAEKLRKVAES